MSDRPATNRNGLVAVGLVAIFAGMVGLTFASVPLYSLFCRATGFAGTPRRATAGADHTLARQVVVRFDANVQGLPWAFRPEQPQVTLKLGETAQVNFIAENLGKTATEGTATFNVEPDNVGIYFNKIQCFCFTQQRLRPGEHTEMAVQFFVSPDMAKDRDLDATRTITLSYTFFPVAGGRQPVAQAGGDANGQKLVEGRRPTAAGPPGGWDRTIMAEAHAKHHDYHLVNPSPWPIIGAVSAFVLALSLIFAMHGRISYWWLAPGIIGVLYTMFSWWVDVIKEAHGGDHTPVVQLHLRYGMIMFIASEVMFFVAWFWAFFDASLYYNEADPVSARAGDRRALAAGGLEVLNPWHLPLVNTLILLTSGTTVTWAHHSLLHNDRQGLKTGLWLTILLGLMFTSIQAYEYIHAPFAFKDNIYGATFFMATGLPRLPCHHRHDLPCRLPGPRLSRPLHAGAAFRLRGGGLVLAFRRRGLAVPLHLHLCLGKRWRHDGMTRRAG